MKPCLTRVRLLETAMDLIWTESYGSVGVEEICRAAKIQKGSFYHFFPSKTALAVTALSEAWEKHRPQVESFFLNGPNPVGRLLAYLDFAIQKQKELRKKFGFFPGCPFTAIGMEQGGRQEILRQTAEKHLDFVRGYFEKTLTEAVRQGQIRVDSPAEKASDVFSLYLGAFTRLRITNNIRVMETVKAGTLTLLGLDPEKFLGAGKKKVRAKFKPTLPRLSGELQAK